MIKITIRPPTREEEERRVQRLRERLAFYEEHGYTPVLPPGDVREVFSEQDYQEDIAWIERERSVIERVAERLLGMAQALEVHLPHEIQVIPTKYGVGGSFDVASGRIRIMRSVQKSAAHLVVHEMLHIATDEMYAKRLHFTHAVNERFIDTLCRDVFGDLLGDYRMQPMGDATADAMLETYVREFSEKTS